jgi:hypothetical protein
MLLYRSKDSNLSLRTWRRSISKTKENKNGADVHKVGTRTAKAGNSNERTAKAGRGKIRIEKEIRIIIVWTC